MGRKAVLGGKASFDREGWGGTTACRWRLRGGGRHWTPAGLNYRSSIARGRTGNRLRSWAVGVGNHRTQSSGRALARAGRRTAGRRRTFHLVAELGKHLDPR